jgi:TRAP-type uncharacterized transport system substrate-binding protein
MTKGFKFSIILFIAFALMAAMAYAEEMRIATGGTGGFYHNGMYTTFAQKVKRFSNGDWEAEYAMENGTDGTLQNISLVEKGDAEIGFCQLGGIITTGANVEVIGTISYELAHLVAPHKGKVTDVDDPESKKKYSVGINSRSGSQVTYDVFKKFDKDYGRAAIMDTPNITRAISQITRGQLDSLFFVSVPGTKTIQRVSAAGLKFLDVDDSDFNDFTNNGTRLYEFVKVGRKEGYPNKFKTVCIPTVVIANVSWLNENKGAFDVLFDATNASKQDIRAKKKLRYYPEN